jgi:hypothetical protein
MKIDEMIWDTGDRAGYVAKGYFQKAEMVAQIVEQFDDIDPDEFNGLEAVQTVLRCIPNGPHSDDKLAFRYATSKPGRGAFRATVIYFD